MGTTLAIEWTSINEDLNLVSNSYKMLFVCSQEDVVMGTLTVRENLHFSAALRLPGRLSKREREERVDATLSDLGLFHVAESKVRLAFKVAHNSFQYFPRHRFWWFLITTLYHLMLQSWYQITAQSPINTLVSISWHNRLP